MCFQVSYQMRVSLISPIIILAFCSACKNIKFKLNKGNSMLQLNHYLQNFRCLLATLSNLLRLFEKQVKFFVLVEMSDKL